MEKNVGEFDAYLRVAGGLTMVAMCAVNLAECDSVWAKAGVVCGAMKVAEGLIRFDPLFHLLGLSTVDMGRPDEAEALE